MSSIVPNSHCINDPKSSRDNPGEFYIKYLNNKNKYPLNPEWHPDNSLKITYPKESEDPDYHKYPYVVFGDPVDIRQIPDTQIINHKEEFEAVCKKVGSPLISAEVRFSRTSKYDVIILPEDYAPEQLQEFLEKLNITHIGPGKDDTYISEGEINFKDGSFAARYMNFRDGGCDEFWYICRRRKINEKKEFLKILKNTPSKMIAATFEICQGHDFCKFPKIPKYKLGTHYLPVGYTKKQLRDFLNLLDFTHNQQCHTTPFITQGYIWFENPADNAMRFRIYESCARFRELWAQNESWVLNYEIPNILRKK
jgi:hypothetical protein